MGVSELAIGLKQATIGVVEFVTAGVAELILPVEQVYVPCCGIHSPHIQLRVLIQCLLKLVLVELGTKNLYTCALKHA